MGIIIVAKCECGFESDEIYAGGGMRNYHDNCSAPAVCLNCNQFLVKNYMKKYAKCPKCRKKVIFYNDKQLQEKSDNERTILEWNAMNDQQFTLPEIKFYCPKCRKKTMNFHWGGLWD